MTTRVRSRRRREHRIVLDEFDKWELRYGDPSNSRLRDLYLASREQLFAEAKPGRLPLGFWAYEPDVPEELRVIPARQWRTTLLESKAPPAWYAEAEAAWSAAEEARAVWVVRYRQSSASYRDRLGFEDHGR